MNVSAAAGSDQPGPGDGDTQPGSDTTPPEAVIKFELESWKITIEGQDDRDDDVNVQASVQSVKGYKSEIYYELTDDAGNMLGVLVEYFNMAGNLEFSLLEMKTSTGEHITFGENHYKVEYKIDKKTGELIHLHQNIHFAGNFKLNSFYTASGETTSIDYEENGCEKVKHKVGGLALVILNSDGSGVELTVLADGREFSFDALRPSVQRITPQQLLEYDLLVGASAIPATVRFGDLSGVPEYISGRWTTDRNLITPQAKAAAFIETYGELYRLDPKRDLLKATEVWNSEELGLTNVRLQQYYDGIPVLGSELLVHLNRNHDVVFVNGVFAPGIDLNTKPRIGAGEAKSDAEVDLKDNNPRIQILSYEPEVLTIYHRSVLDRYSEGEGILVWNVVINTATPDGEWYCLVDARTGEIVEAWNNYQGRYSDGMPWTELLYLRQSGAIQEAYASIFEGSLDCTTPLTDPGWDGEIDHWDQFTHFRDTCDATNDNCGVGQNSGILTKLFRLLAYGGSHYGLATNGIGTTLTKKVFLATLTDTGLSSSATFHEVRDVMFETGDGMLSGSSGWSGLCQASTKKVWLSIGILEIDQTFGWDTNDNYDQFGWALTKGDFNNDSYEDLAISIPFEDVKADNDGMVMVFYGSPGGLQQAGSERLTLNLAGEDYRDDDNFGYTLAAGDFDGDGFDDLAIGVPFKDKSASKYDVGSVVIYYGADDGLVPDPSGWPPLSLPPRTETIDQTWVNRAEENTDKFGHSLAVGDFDNDTFDDLAVGMPYENNPTINEGLVIIFYGTDEGFIPDTDLPIPVPLFNTECISQTDAGSTNNIGDRFGYSLAAGDFDDDDYSDLAVGVPRKDTDSCTNNGEVIVFYGSNHGLLPSYTHEFLNMKHGDLINEDDDEFGFALTSGDFDGDGFDDLAVGIPHKMYYLYEESGYIQTFNGTEWGFVTTHILGVVVPIEPVQTIHQVHASGENEVGDLFGSVLCTGDLDADGFDDLVVGQPYESWDNFFIYDNGIVRVLYGSSTWMLEVRSYGLHQSYFGGVDKTDDWFGHAVVAGDFNGNGKDALAASAPGQDYPGDITDAGTVFVRELEPALPPVTAGSAIVYSRTLDKILGIKMPDWKRPMASTTKIMTALLTIERINLPLSDPDKLNLNDLVGVSINGDDVGGSNMAGNLTLYDMLSLQDLLYGLMLPSGNDAAVVIAEHLTVFGGGEQDGAFSDLMNIRASELGLPSTHYTNPYGSYLSGTRTTTRDLARLADFALEDSLFKQIVGTYQYTTTSWVDSTSTPKNALQNNTNRFLNSSSSWDWSIAYGVKTGTSSIAGQCLVSAIDDGTVDIIAVVLNSEDRYRDS
jgi:Zn-dependent metalloprotease